MSTAISITPPRCVRCGNRMNRRRWEARCCCRCGGRRFVGQFAERVYGTTPVRNPHPVPKQSSLQRTLLQHREVDPATNCWVWTGKWEAGGNSVGYGIVYLNGYCHLVHRVAAHVWLGSPLFGGVVCHRRSICRTPACFNPEHLAYFPSRRAALDAGNAKLAPNQVREYRRRRASGERVSQLAKEFGCTTATLYNIDRGHTWKTLS